MSEQLVEAVARLYEKKWGVRDYLLALDAIALIRPATLEEAAKVCDALASDPRMYSSERRRGAGQCAAAIRALKDET